MECWEDVVFVLRVTELKSAYVDWDTVLVVILQLGHLRINGPN